MTRSRYPNVRNFRRTQAAAAERRGKGGPRTPWQAYKFDMDIGDEAALRFKPHEPFIYESHGWPPHTCTANEELWPEFKGKCVFCYYNERDKKFRDKYYRRMKYVLEVVDFRYFHWEVGTNKHGKETTLVHVCQDVDPNPRRSRCPHCRSTDEFIKERRFGRYKRWELSEAQFAQITDTYDRLAHICVEGEGDEVCGEKIFEVGYNCAGCSKELISEHDLQTKDCNELINNELECPHCGHEDFPKAVLLCNSDEHDAVPGSLYDKMLTVTCSGTVKEVNGKDRTLKVFSFEINQWPWSRLEDDLGNFGIEGDLLKEITAETNLRQRYRPEPSVKRDDFEDVEEYVEMVLKAQAEACKKPLPEEYKAAPGSNRSTGARAWGRGKRS